MSLCVSVYTRQGIVMGSDSRGSLTFNNKQAEQTMVIQGSHFFDNTQKTCLLPNNCGMSWSGDAMIKGVLASEHIENFIKEKIKKSTVIGDLPKLALEYFNTLQKGIDSEIIFAGYQSKDKDGRRVYHLNLKDGSHDEISHNSIGIHFSGEKAFVTRMFHKSTIHAQDGSIVEMEALQIPLDLMSLQDVVDFVRFVIEFTGKALHFSSQPETVGGQTDILVMTPETSWFISGKVLH